jgi:arginine metabolism regulation protein II
MIRLAYRRFLNLPNFQPPSPVPELVHNFSFSLPGYDPQVQQMDPQESIPPSVTTDSSVPHDAVYLIKHYSTIVLTLLTPFRHSKTPWHVLFVPHAKSCLAALTLGEVLDHASLCAFYATISISAFSLGE